MADSPIDFGSQIHIDIDSVNIRIYIDAVNTVGITMRTSKTYHHGNLKSELVQAALLILDKDGVEGVGIRQVARKVGVAHSAPANHFKNKQALITSVVEAIFQHLLRTIESRFQQGPTLRESVHMFCQAIFEFGLNYPYRYRLMWRRDCVDNSDVTLQTSMEAVYQKLISILDEQAKQKRVDVESQAIAIWSIIHGYVSLRLDGNLQQGQDQVTEQGRETAIIGVLLDGLI